MYDDRTVDVYFFFFWYSPFSCCKRFVVLVETPSTLALRWVPNLMVVIQITVVHWDKELGVWLLWMRSLCQMKRRMMMIDSALQAPPLLPKLWQKTIRSRITQSMISQYYVLVLEVYCALMTKSIPSKERKKFSFATSERLREDSEFPWGSKPQTFGFPSTMLYHWATVTLKGATL